MNKFKRGDRIVSVPSKRHGEVTSQTGIDAVQVEFDDGGRAVLPETLLIREPDDRTESSGTDPEGDSS